MGSAGCACTRLALQMALLPLFAALLANAANANYTTIELTHVGDQGHHGMSIHLDDGSVSSILVDTTQYQLGVVQCGSSESSSDCDTLGSLYETPDQAIGNPGHIWLDIDFKNRLTLDCDSDDAPCLEINATVSLTSSGAADESAIVPILLSENMTVDNPALHPFYSSHGVLGLGYKATTSSSTPSPFELLLASVTNSSRVFGLDFQSNESAVLSTMQLGGIAEEYADSFIWGEQQLREQPLTHNVFIEDFSTCGISIFGNWSENWEVRVDSLSTCLVLPEEFYKTVVAWLPVNETDADGNLIRDQSGQAYAVIPTALLGSPLPPIKFRLAARSGYLYIALSDLLLSSTILMPEYQSLGAPLCIIKGAAIAQKGVYASTAPQIVFGARVLQSLYFAADMGGPTAGFANKHDPSEMETLVSTGVCMPSASCIGFQKYSESLNRCQDPGCTNYFFMQLNDANKSCEWKPSAVAAGIIIVTMLAVCELVVYLVTQYSLSENTSIAVDPITWQLGRWATKLFDDALLALKPELRRRTVPAADAQ